MPSSFSPRRHTTVSPLACWSFCQLRDLGGHQFRNRAAAAGVVRHVDVNIVPGFGENEIDLYTYGWWAGSAQNLHEIEMIDVKNVGQLGTLVPCEDADGSWDAHERLEETVRDDARGIEITGVRQRPYDGNPAYRLFQKSLADQGREKTPATT